MIRPRSLFIINLSTAVVLFIALGTKVRSDLAGKIFQGCFLSDEKFCDIKNDVPLFV